MSGSIYLLAITITIFEILSRARQPNPTICFVKIGDNVIVLLFESVTRFSISGLPCAAIEKVEYNFT